MFCPKLHKLLKPIYDLTRKGRHFIWVKEQQEAFEEIKRRLIKAPVLYVPNWEGRFHLYLDTSTFAAGSALYQIQNGKPKLIAYASKMLPEAVRRYLITELELCGLAINIASFLHLLRRVDFDVIVDHLALTHIIKSKAELATPRIKRLLELISSYSFNIYYMKGKDMILSDFLSRQMQDDSNPHKIIHISFNTYNVLYETYYKVEMKAQYLLQTQSQTKVTGIVLLEVHRAKKATAIESLKPQIPVKQVDKNRPKLGWSRAGIKHKKTQPVADTQASLSKSSKIPTVQNVTKDSMDFQVPDWLITNETETITRREIQGKNREQPFYPDLIYRPPPRPPENLWPKSPENMSVNKPKIDIVFEENSPHQEGIISEFFQGPNKLYLQQPKDPENLVNTGNLVQTFLPKQTDIDKILKIIQWKVLKGTHLSVTVKEIQAGYLSSSYFKDTYLYLAQNNLPSSKAVVRKIEALVEKYILLDSLLFKISTTSDKETVVLAILETCVDSIITLYHSSLFVGHPGVIKTYITI